MLTATERAAQIWCLPEFSGREMDAAFAGAIAQAIERAVKEERERIVGRFKLWRTQYDQPGQSGMMGAVAQSCIDSAIGIVGRD